LMEIFDSNASVRLFFGRIVNRQAGDAGNG
jgi:hypothetical protein